MTTVVIIKSASIGAGAVVKEGIARNMISALGLYRLNEHCRLQDCVGKQGVAKQLISGRE